MASKKDMRREDLSAQQADFHRFGLTKRETVVPYVDTAKEKGSETDITSTMSSTLPMAAVCTSMISFLCGCTDISRCSRETSTVSQLIPQVWPTG